MYLVFFWIADLDPEKVIYQPIYWLVLIKHNEKLNQEAKVTWSKKFPCKRNVQFKRLRTAP